MKKSILQFVESDTVLALVSPFQFFIPFPEISRSRLRETVISELRLCCLSRCDKRPTSLPVVVEGRHVLRIDATVAKNLALLLSDLAARDQKIIFWNWCEDARQTLISYDPSLMDYCKSSGSIEQIFSGKILVSRFIAFFHKKTYLLTSKISKNYNKHFIF